MPNDAKLGLVVGLVLVAMIAVVFFRKEPLVAPSAVAAPSVDNRPAKGPPSPVGKAPNRENLPLPKTDDAVPLPPPPPPGPIPLPPPKVK